MVGELSAELARRDAEDGAPFRTLIVVGTRPEAIKLFPVILALQASRWIEPYVVTTGQHAHLVDPVLEMAGIRADADLGVGRPGQTLNDIVCAVMSELDQLLHTLRGGPERRTRPRAFSVDRVSPPRFPAATIVHGDTTSAMAAALASANASLPVAHVEAGLRTGDRLSPFPEEMNRQLIARLASFHLSPTVENKENLIREGVDARLIFVTGNTGLDALRWAANRQVPWPDPRLAAVDADRPVIVVTAHRRENWGPGLRGIAEGVARVAKERPDVLVVLPLHPNPRVREDLEPPLAGLDNVLLTEPLDYAAFARLLARATLAISDSGGIQEEAPSVGTPVLVARDTSERAEGVEAGTLLLVGTDPERIAWEALRLLGDPEAYREMQGAANPFGDGQAAERIVSALEHLAFDTPPPAPYGPGFSRAAVLANAGYSDGDDS